MKKLRFRKKDDGVNEKKRRREILYFRRRKNRFIFYNVQSKSSVAGNPILLLFSSSLHILFLLFVACRANQFLVYFLFCAFFALFFPADDNDFLQEPISSRSAWRQWQRDDAAAPEALRTTTTEGAVEADEDLEVSLAEKWGNLDRLTERGRSSVQWDVESFVCLCVLCNESKGRRIPSSADGNGWRRELRNSSKKWMNRHELTSYSAQPVHRALAGPKLFGLGPVRLVTFF